MRAAAVVMARIAVGMSNQHVTIDDVARRAGLSVATVSRVMHDNPRVSPQARQRVNEAIDALGYTPNALARGLAMRSTQTIGVLVSSIADPFWAEVTRGIEDYAHQAGYGVLIASSYEDATREQNSMKLFRHKRVDGIVVGASSSGPSALNSARAHHLPVVFINSEHIDPDDAVAAEPTSVTEADHPSAYLVADDTHGALLLVEHLLALGHTRVAYIGATGRASSVRRLHGYRQALQQAGLALDETLVVLTGEGANDGELGAFRLLTRDSRPTALFCYDDMTALGALRAARALQLHTPTDVSIVGFDDIPIAAYLDPPLTTVRQPMYEMGQQAMTMLVALLRGADPLRYVTMPGELVTRSSSGLAPI